MSVATLDESLLPILEKATDRVEIRSKDGRVIGHFLPIVGDEYARKSPFTDDQLRDLQRSKGECIPLAEVWKRIGVK